MTESRSARSSDDSGAEPPPLPTGDLAAGRSLITRALVAGAIVHALTLLALVAIGDDPAMLKVAARLTALLGIGGALLRWPSPAGRWALIVLFVLWGCERGRFIGQIVPTVSAITFFACAAAVASSASRRFAEHSVDPVE